MKAWSIAVCLLVVVPVTLAQAARVTAKASPQSITLQLSDMPVGFTQVTGKVWTNAVSDKASHFAAGTYARHGRVTGYETDFKKSAIAGLIDVGDWVNLYRSPGAARWSLVGTEANAKRPLKGHAFVPMSVGAIGAEAAGYQWQGKSGNYNFTVYVVLFRQGDYAVKVLGLGVTGTVFPEQVVSLATVIAHRIPHSR
jgi:hypothetical protein